jgi:hypothetical protein
VLGLSAAELGSGAHALERMWPWIDRTLAIVHITTKLECNVLKYTSL